MPAHAMARVGALREDQVTTNLLNRLAFGVILVDAEGRAVRMNQAAERIVESADGLTLAEGVVRPARSFERSKLSHALAQAAKESGSSARAFLVGRPSGRMPYAVLVVPFAARPLPTPRRRRPVAALVVADFEARSAVSIGVLKELFGFTTAEAKLAVAMAQGGSLLQISQNSGRSLSTLRSQLSAMFEKTSVKRQADIVRLVLCIPAIRL